MAHLYRPNIIYLLSIGEVQFKSVFPILMLIWNSISDSMTDVQLFLLVDLILIVKPNLELKG